MAKLLNVAAYCRVSTDKSDQANSLESQIKYFTDYINKHPEWNLVDVFYDEGISGTSTKKRASFNRMIKSALSGKIDLILTKEVSRFARNTVDTLTYTRDLKAQNVGVFFISDNIDTLDKDGELRLSIMATIAQEESRKTSERVKWGQKRRMEQGVVFGRDMLGYFVKEGQLIINPDEVPIVKLIYHKFLNEGKGTHVIARELREAGIRPKRVKEWSAIVILRALRNEKYVGDLLQKKTYTPDYLSHAKKYNRGNEDMVYLKDHHELIIDREMWNSVQKELARRSPSDEQKSKHSNRYWCSGKLICGECGRRFVSRTKKLGDGSTYKAWRCYAAANHGTAKQDIVGNHIGCNSDSINDKVLLSCVGYVLSHIQTKKDDIIKQLMRDIRSLQSISVSVDTTKLYAQIDEINSRKIQAIDLTLRGSITEAELRMQKAKYDEDIADITQKIAQAENANSIHQTQVESIESYIFEIKRILSFDSENESLYREMVDKVKIFNKKVVEVYLKCVPFGIRLHYSTSGRLANFKVKVDKMEVVD